MISATPETIELITSRYQRVVGTLDHMFRVASLRTEVNAWKDDEVGSCAYISSKTESEEGLTGVAKNLLIELREKRNREFGGTSTLTGCPYHRTGYGCVLGNLKAPICIRYFDHSSYKEWREQFGINPIRFREGINSVLREILICDPQRDDASISWYLECINRRTQTIESEPILHNPPFANFHLECGIR